MAADEVGKVSLGLELDSGDGKAIEQQIAGVGKRSGSAFAGAISGALRSAMNGFRAAAKPVKLPQVEIEPAKVDVDADAVKGQLTQLEQVLENVNAKIDVQQRKLAGLKDAYENTFNDDRKAKLQSQIVNTEGALLRLTKQSDTTVAKIWKLEDSLKGAGSAATQASPSVAKVGAANAAASKPTTKLTGDLNKATKAATNTSKSFAAAGKSSGKMGNQFTQAFGRIAKQVLVFAVLYKAIRGFQDYMGSSMRTNQQYVASLNAIKTNLATAFQPVFNAIMPALNSFMSWLAKATAYVAAFMASLFGTSYKQSFAAAKGLQQARKEMDGYGKSAKKAAMGLSALDDFNLIKTQEDDKGGGGGAKPGDWDMEMPELDLDSIQAKTDSLVAGMKASFDGVWDGLKAGWKRAVNTFGPTFAAAWAVISPELEKWKTSFMTVFNDIVALGAPLKDWFTNNLVPAWQNGVVMATGIVSGLLESVRLVFDSIWAAVYPIINKFVTDGLPRITEFVVSVQTVLSSLFSVVKEIFDSIWRDAVDPALQLVSQIIRDTLDIIFEWWDTWGVGIMDGLKTVLDNIKELWRSMWDNFLKPFIDNMLNMLTQLWDKHLKGLVKEVGVFIGKLVTAALDIYNKFVVPITKYLLDKLGPTFSNIFSFIGDVVGTAVGIISDVIKGLLRTLGGVIDFIAGVFTGDWKKAWQGIQDFMGGFGDALIGIFKGAVNLIIDVLNFLVRQINKIKIDVPSWVSKIPGVPKGITSVGFKIPEIPKLAKGGLAYGPTLAMVGDNRGAAADPEVISPLSKLQDMLAGSNATTDALLMSMLEVLREIARKDPSIKIGETELARAVNRSSDGYYQRTGFAHP